jgi:hypothetical protein
VCSQLGYCLVQAPVGEACTSSGTGGAGGAAGAGGTTGTETSCLGGYCLEAWFGYPEGYCTQFCKVDGDCITGAHCDLTQATCVKSCATTAECRTGYQCVDNVYGYQDGRTECMPQ